MFVFWRLHTLFPAETHALYDCIFCLWNNYFSEANNCSFSICFVFCVLINNLCQALLKQSKIPLGTNIWGNLSLPPFWKPSSLCSMLDWLMPSLHTGVTWDLLPHRPQSPSVSFPCGIPHFPELSSSFSIYAPILGEQSSSSPLRTGAWEVSFLGPCVSENIFIPPSHWTGNQTGADLPVSTVAFEETNSTGIPNHL